MPGNAWWRENGKLMSMTGNALFLQIKKPLLYDLYIPEFLKLENFYEKEVLNKGSSKNFAKRVVRGLELCFLNVGGDDTHPLNTHLGEKDVFGSEWFFGHGTLYRFRDGKKQQIKNEVERYFNKRELESFEEIGRLIEPYTFLWGKRFV
ncbi:MAG: hypothetical protein ABIE36_01060 [Candidatus Diapherotrites archaeon]